MVRPEGATRMLGVACHRVSRSIVPHVQTDEPDDTVPMGEDPPADGDGSFDLVRRARRGDRTALDSLFERYYSRVMTIVRLRMG